MKSTNNKLISLLGNIVIAFTITLFLPSLASATWGNYTHGSKAHGSSNHGSKAHGSKNHGSTCNTGSHGSSKHGSKAHGSKAHGSNNHGTVDCSKYEKLADKYQKLADKYMKKYNNTHCYSYYNKYVCFAKKAADFKKKFDQCTADTAIDCDNYKVLADKYKELADKYKACADKYLAAYNNTCSWWYKNCYYKYYLSNLKKYKENMALYNQYMDKYNDCQAQNLYGSVTGYVYEDADKNAAKDAGEVGKAGILVILTDGNGKEYTTTTDATGKYKFDKVLKGTVSIKVTETGLPDDATLYTTHNPQTLTVESGKSNDAEYDVGYTLPDPLDTDGDGVPDVTDIDDDNDGILDIDEGNGAVDTDGDGIVDSLDLDSDNDTIPDNVEAQPTDTYVAPTGTDTDNDGLDDAYDTDNCGTSVTNPDTDGDGTVDALDLDSDNDGINDITEVGQPDANNDGMTDNSVGTNGLDDTVEAEDTYADTNGNIDNPSALQNTQNPDTPEVDYRDDSLPVTEGSTFGYVLIDGVGEANVTVSIVDEDGNPYDSVITDADGKYIFPEVTQGVATITIDESTLPSGLEQVTGVNPSTVSIIAGENVDAGVDSYRTLPTLECPVGFEKLEMTVFTSGSNTSDNLQTILPIDIDPNNIKSITFQKVWTSDKNDNIQPNEQFMIVAVDGQANLLSNTIYTTDINNITHEDEYSDLGTIPIDSNFTDLLLVHRADPTYGDNLPDGNSVTFRGLCYKLKVRI
ncbi:internalin, putative [hydrothermal vent metagenome]|uniref:Internalin, putative n=1 Tax=hydrothermal vent metagenome TaxID=652676 RepID=A0A1W1ED24_9ZZZZ